MDSEYYSGDQSGGVGTGGQGWGRSGWPGRAEGLGTVPARRAPRGGGGARHLPRPRRSGLEPRAPEGAVLSRPGALLKLGTHGRVFKALTECRVSPVNRIFIQELRMFFENPSGPFGGRARSCIDFSLRVRAGPVSPAALVFQ